ncbi:MAG: hypothetical protein GXW85_01285 [Clostridia bacterium]|nr:hypothetical protein [Clostridia bacterium]
MKLTNSKSYCHCIKVPPGEISDNILNPLTSIKGYIQLQLKDDRYVLDEKTLLLILSEIIRIEEAVKVLERHIDEKNKK